MIRIPNQDRHARLRNLQDIPRGNVWMAKCRCGHLAPLPVASLIKRYGELFPIEQAMFHVKCSACGKSGTAEAQPWKPPVSLTWECGAGREAEAWRRIGWWCSLIAAMHLELP